MGCLAGVWLIFAGFVSAAEVCAARVGLNEPVAIFAEGVIAAARSAEGETRRSFSAPVPVQPIYVVGAVSRPGAYPYRAGLTVAAAASLAGGFLDDVEDPAISVSRDADAIEFQAALSAALKPGDVIRIW